MEVILVGRCGKCQSIKKVGRRRFVESLYQAVFSFRLAHRNVIHKAKRKLSLISGYESQVLPPFRGHLSTQNTTDHKEG